MPFITDGAASQKTRRSVLAQRSSLSARFGDASGWGTGTTSQAIVAPGSLPVTLYNTQGTLGAPAAVAPAGYRPVPTGQNAPSVWVRDSSSAGGSWVSSGPIWKTVPTLPPVNVSQVTGQSFPDLSKFPAAPVGYPYPGDPTIPLDNVLPEPKSATRYGGLSSGPLWNALSWRKRVMWALGPDPGNNPSAIILMSPKEQAFFAADIGHTAKGYESWQTAIGAAVMIGVAGIATAGVISAVAAAPAAASVGGGVAPAIEPVSLAGGGVGATGTSAAATAVSGSSLAAPLATSAAGGGGLLATGGTAALGAGAKLGAPILSKLGIGSTTPIAGSIYPTASTGLDPMVLALGVGAVLLVALLASSRSKS